MGYILYKAEHLIFYQGSFNIQQAVKNVQKYKMILNIKLYIYTIWKSTFFAISLNIGRVKFTDTR